MGRAEADNELGGVRIERDGELLRQLAAERRHGSVLGVSSCVALIIKRAVSLARVVEKMWLQETHFAVTAWCLFHWQKVAKHYAKARHFEKAREVEERKTRETWNAMWSDSGPKNQRWPSQAWRNYQARPHHEPSKVVVVVKNHW